MLSVEKQLGFALEAFQEAHKLGAGWATSKLLCFREAGIQSMDDLYVGCKDRTINLDLELFGIPPEDQLKEKEIALLQSFLPGPRGFRCFRLAQMASNKVAKGDANSEYVHRPENGKKGKETWHTPVGGDWVINVDCAGFVRNCLKHVTKDPFLLSLSDRDFMRAKDFYVFFDSIPYMVTDPTPVPETDRRMKWRKVDDLRMLIPGDVICYRPRGNSAGGAAFTTNDRKDLPHLLKAVKMALVWHEASSGEWKEMVTINVARDPAVRPWVAASIAKLNQLGISSVKQLYLTLDTLNEKLKAVNMKAFKPETIALMRECAETTSQNTGHIVFAAGPAVQVSPNEYRVRVVHSTKHGYTDDQTGEVVTGVQEYFRRFQVKERADGTTYWTREMKQAKPLIDPKVVTPGYGTDDEENPLDDMEEESEDEILVPESTPEASESEPPGDDCAGQADIEVIAARMCF